MFFDVSAGVYDQQKSGILLKLRYVLCQEPKFNTERKHKIRGPEVY